MSFDLQPPPTLPTPTSCWVIVEEKPRPCGINVTVLCDDNSGELRWQRTRPDGSCADRRARFRGDAGWRRALERFRRAMAAERRRWRHR